MKFLFIVQGEGRGHFTQAITLEEMLMKEGHEVVEVLVGKSSNRTLPGFFNRSIHAPVKRFISPNFLPTAQNKRAKVGRSVAYNLLKLPVYLRSMLYIKERIKATRTDVVVNFYELLTGLTYTFLRPEVPYVCIGHQYLFLHPDFEFPGNKKAGITMLRLFTRMTSLRASKRLALSFRNMLQDREKRIIVVPPLLRSEVISMEGEKGDYVHGYMVNSGFADSVLDYHFQHPEVKMHFFWDKTDAPEESKITENLSFHQIDDLLFLKYMVSCRAYASTAGFESICEAMYLGKPVMMVPAHIEQDCNAYDAARAGAGIVAESFELDRLLEFADSYQPNKEFVYWARSSGRLIISELEEVANERSMINVATLAG